MKPYGLKRKQGWYTEPWENPKNDVKNHKRERQESKQKLMFEINTIEEE